MNHRDTDYLYISTRLKARSQNLFSREKLNRLIAARTGEDAVKLLTENGWAAFAPDDLSACEAEIARRGAFIFIPEQWDLTSYKMLWSSRQNLIRAYGNTLFRVIVGTSMNLAFTIALAYPLSKRNLKGRTAINALVFFTMIFSGGMVPTYMMVKWTGLINTRWALILPSLIGTWNMFMMRNFFYAIPESLIESAELDGANQWQILTRIVLPCSLATIATILLFYAVGHWNSFMDTLLYVTDYRLNTLQYLLYQYINEARNLAAQIASGNIGVSEIDPSKVVSPTSVQLTVTIVVVFPILCVYPFLQRYYVKGIMIGAVKG
mgnify:CR=1 FL=1